MTRRSHDGQSDGAAIHMRGQPDLIKFDMDLLRTSIELPEAGVHRGVVEMVRHLEVQVLPEEATRLICG
jgi:hypothetical protein